MADDGTAMDTALIGNRLIPGEALVGFAVAEGEEGGVGCPDRAGQSGHVPVGDFLKPNPVIFCFAGFGFGGFAVGCGMSSWIFYFPTTPPHVVHLAQFIESISGHTGRVRVPWSFCGRQTFSSFRAMPFLAELSCQIPAIRITPYRTVS